MNVKLRLPVACLVAVVLVFGGVWYWLVSGDDSSPAVHAPESAPVATADSETAADAETTDEPSPAPAPVAPPTDDESAADGTDPADAPASRELSVRYVDVDTGQPVANARCDEYASFVALDDPGQYLVRVAGRYYGWDVTDATDARGRVAVTAEVHFTDTAREADIALPVPEGWFVWTCWTELHRALADRAWAGSAEVLEVPVRRAASLALDVTDTGGAPLRNFAVTLSWDVQTSGAPFTDALSRAAAGAVISSQDVDEPLLLDDLHRVEFWPNAMLEQPYSEPYWPEALFNNHIQQATTDARLLFTGSSGRVEFRGLPPGTYTLVFEDNQGELLEQELELTPGVNSHEITIEQPVLNTVVLTVEWGDPDEERPLTGNLELAAILDGSRIMPVGAQAPGIAGYNHRLSASGALLQGQIRDLADGVWLISFRAGGKDANKRVEVRGGRTVEATLTIASKEYATWEPTVLFDGQVVPYLTLTLTGALDLTLSTLSGEALEVPPGWYIASVPGAEIEPVVREFAPGEVRRDVFEIPAARIQFAISSRLYTALGGDDNRVFLQLTPPEYGWLPKPPEQVDSEEWAGAFDGQYVNELRPGSPVNTILPVGPLGWILYFHSRWDQLSLVQGSIDIPSGGSQQLYLDVESLLGLAVLDIVLDGFGTEDRMQVYASSLSYAVYSTVSRDGRLLAPDEMWGGATTVWMTDTRVLVFARQGSVHLSLYHLGDDGYDDYGDATISTAIPGALWITPADFGTLGGTLRIVDEEQMTLRSFLSAWGISETHGVRDLSIGEQELPLGRWRVVVSDDIGDEAGMAIVDLNIDSGTQTLDVGSLSFRRGGALHVLMSGASTQAPYAIEMLDWEVRGDIPRLDGAEGEGPRVWLSPARAEYRYRNLPPGRYRVIPCKDSPQSEGIIVEIKPGQTTTITAGSAD
jgi:hypothetical protein